MDPINNEPVATVKNPNAHLTTIASVAAIIDITVGAITAMDGDGIELIDAQGGTMTTGSLRDTVSSLVYRTVSADAISHEAIQGSNY